MKSHVFLGALVAGNNYSCSFTKRQRGQSKKWWWDVIKEDMLALVWERTWCCTEHFGGRGLMEQTPLNGINTSKKKKKNHIWASQYIPVGLLLRNCLEMFTWLKTSLAFIAFDSLQLLISPDVSHVSYGFKLTCTFHIKCFRSAKGISHLHAARVVCYTSISVGLKS